jgi:hypothetical protein
VKRFSPSYKARCLAALQSFAQPGDRIVRLRPYTDPEEVCFLCGKDAIIRCVPLYNSRTGEQIIVGSECAQNYRVFLRELQKRQRNEPQDEKAH